MTRYRWAMTVPAALPPTPPDVSVSDYRDALSRLAGGVAVVTTLDPLGRDAGITVTSFAAISLDPPLVLISVRTDAFVADALGVSDGFAVSMLSEGQLDLARYSARHRHPTSRDDFSPWPHERGVGHAVVFSDAVAAVECVPYAEHPAGDHTLLLGRVVRTRLGPPDAAALVYADRAYHAIGGAKAPSRRDEDIEAPHRP